jgi:hypothetical protein
VLAIIRLSTNWNAIEYFSPSRPPNYAQENGEYLSTKRYLRNDKMRLARFMELANITSTNIGDQAIEFPELYDIYS